MIRLLTLLLAMSAPVVVPLAYYFRFARQKYADCRGLGVSGAARQLVARKLLTPARSLSLVGVSSLLTASVILQPYSPIAALLTGLSYVVLLVAWILFPPIPPWSFARIIKIDFRICPFCDYMLLTGIEDGICPECGCPYSHQSLQETWELARNARIWTNWNG